MSNKKFFEVFPTLTIDEKVTEKKELTNLKRQYTKIKNELDSLLIKEKTLKNTTP